MNLTESDKDILMKMGYPKKVQLSLGEYYVKMIDREVAVKELIGYYFAKALCLETAEVKIVDIDNGEIYCLSEDLAKEGVFYPISSLEEINTSFYDVWELFKKRFYNVESLILDFIKVYILDTFLLNTDRTFENFGIRIIGENEKLCILDHELILKENCHFYLTPDFDVENNIGNDKSYRKEQLKKFLMVYRDFIDIFLEIYYLFTPAFFDEVLRMIKINHKIEIQNEEELKKIYLENYNDISEILQANKLLDGKRI